MRDAEKKRAYDRTYRAANRDKIRKYRKNWYEKHKRTPEFQAARRAYRAANRERCNAWRRNSRLRRKYGITPKDYEALLLAQRGRCAICRVPSPKGHGYWHLDHCHKSGKVRGLLCQGCNHGLGNFLDNPRALRRAAQYVEKHGRVN